MLAQNRAFSSIMPRVLMVKIRHFRKPLFLLNFTPRVLCKMRGIGGTLVEPTLGVLPDGPGLLLSPDSSRKNKKGPF